VKRGVVAVTTTPEGTLAKVNRDVEIISRVIRTANVQLD
jgi:hypothetical protein